MTLAMEYSTFSQRKEVNKMLLNRHIYDTLMSNTWLGPTVHSTKPRQILAAALYNYCQQSSKYISLTLRLQHITHSGTPSL